MPGAFACWHFSLLEIGASRKQAEVGRTEGAGKNASWNSVSLERGCLFLFIRTVFAKLNRLWDSVRLWQIWMQSVLEVLWTCYYQVMRVHGCTRKEQPNRTFVCSGYYIFYRTNHKFLASLICGAPEYLSQADISGRLSKHTFSDAKTSRSHDRLVFWK